MLYSFSWRATATRLFALMGLVVCLSQSGHATNVDIASTPLINLTTVAKPNVMMVLDDSGSMSWSFMPDDMSNNKAYGYFSSQCNGVAYNPAVDYAPPKNPSGESFPNMGFGAVWENGYAPSLTNVTASTSTLNLAAGDQTLTVGSTVGYNVNTSVVIQYNDTTDPNNTVIWMVGTVASVAGNNTLNVHVTFASSLGPSGSGTASNWKVGIPKTTNLSAVNPVYYAYQPKADGTSPPRMSWTYNSNAVNTDQFYRECMTPVGTATALFLPITPGQDTVDAAKYANWYAYYRTRVQMARTVLTRAFSDLDSTIRVGYTTIHDTTATPSKTFLDVDTFDINHKNTFYIDLYQANPSGSTPLRAALAKAGQYYANNAKGQSHDPVQYACQRNYTIMSTDGYWNTQEENANYGPTKIDRKTKVGEQDGDEATPMWDGAGSTKISTTSETVTTTTVQQAIHTVPLGDKTEYALLARCALSFAYTRTVTPGSGTRVDTTTTTSQATTVYTTETTVISPKGGKTTITTTASSPPAVSVANTVTTNTWQPSGGAPTVDCVPLFPNPGGTSYVEGPASDTTSSTSSSTPPVKGPSTGPTTTYSGGSSDTLADVAEYYYNTDLRNSTFNNCTGSAGVDVCADLVPASGRDVATYQHMTTFTIGLGVGGMLHYDGPDYLNQITCVDQQKCSTYYDLISGNISWPVAGPNGSAVNVDDLWHAAVNGRGQYFSATDPDSLAQSLGSIFSNISAAAGAGAAPSVSSQKPQSGLDFAYVASYTTGEWSGDVTASQYALNASGQVDLTALGPKQWSVRDRLDALRASTSAGAQQRAKRQIYYMKPAVGTTASTLASFDYSQLPSTWQGYFDNLCGTSSVVTQCNSLSTAQKIEANKGVNLVNFLRSDPSFEIGTNKAFPLYRQRAHALGDIVNSSPTYVAASHFSYGDAGFVDYQISVTATRKPMIYVGANDGMLHAFSADNKIGGDGGTELWAFVPSMAMPNLYQLADRAYGTHHRFYVNATPVVADVQIGGTWRTMLVGGLGAGGKGYYALDITDPTAPKAMWEFTSPNLGFSYADAVVTKRADGTWVVAVPSGYNNGGTGDGNGHLFILDAATGKLVKDVPTYTALTATPPTPAGTPANPSNLAKINAWVEDVSNNTALRYYGGDELGNLWRFDVDGLVEPKNSAMVLAKLQFNGVPQPISVMPELAVVGVGVGPYPAVFVATGRYLGTPDLTDTTQQSVYFIKDPLTQSGWGDVHANTTDFVHKTRVIDSQTNAVSLSTNAVDWSINAGWYMDFPNAGERVFVDMKFQNDTLVLVSGKPIVDAQCKAAGESWAYEFDVQHGTLTQYLALPNFLAVGVNIIATGTDGKTSVLISGSDGSVTPLAGPTANNNNTSAHRTSWRELYR